MVLEAIKAILRKSKVCRNSFHVVPLAKKLKPLIENVKVTLPSSVKGEYQNRTLKLEKSSPESKLRLQYLKEFSVQPNASEKSKNFDTFFEDFQAFLDGRSALQIDKILEDTYKIIKDSERNEEEDFVHKAGIEGVVLRTSPSYVSLITLDGSEELLVKVNREFVGFGIKVRTGDVINVAKLTPNKGSDLDPELRCCYDMSKDEVDIFFKNVRQLLPTDNPLGIPGKFERSLAVWQHIINVSIMKEENNKEQDGEVSKNILQICKVFSDFQAQTQITMIGFWDALEDSRFFNKALPEIIKDEAWQEKDNVNLLENFLENLLKAHPECAIRAIGILKSLTCIPVERGVEFNRKLFSMIAPFVIGVSEKPKNPESSCSHDISDAEVDNFIENVKQLTDNPFGILGKFERSLAVWQHIINVSIIKGDNDKEPDGEISKNILEICKIFGDFQAQTQMTTIMIRFWDAVEDSRFFNNALPEIIKDEAWQRDNINLVENLLENLLKVHPECAVRANGILESLTCIPAESGVEFIQKLFSIIAPFVTGVSKKTKHLKWNQKSVIPLPTELEHDPEHDYKDLQPVRVKKDEDEEEEKKQKKGSKKKNEIAYKSEEEYIETYYALLRVECFHKVKKGIYSFVVKRKCDPKDNMLYCVKLIGISDRNELPIHEGLSLVLECHHNNETNKSDLDADQDNSKWLMLGNLICLSLDVTFENPVWGVISKERTAEDSNQKHVHVSLCTKNNRLRDSEVITQLQELKSQGLPAFMIESDTFYPAFGPILEVLKNKVTVPFAEQLVKVKKSPLASRQQSPDHSVALHYQCHFQWMFAKLLAKHKMKSYCSQEDKACELQNSGPNYLRHITKPPKWDVIFENPSSSDCNVSSGFYDVVQEFKKMREDPESKPKLDNKQLDAVEQALFNKVALIQGPPGTGKSYVGKALLHLLLSMEVPKHGPILIATYKNYSLDEFLESFLGKNPEFKKDVVRVGRSKEGTSELLQQCNLSQLTSGTMEKQMHQNLKELDRELYLIKKEIYQCFTELENSNHFTASLFLKEANEKHLKSLLKDKKERIDRMMKDENFRGDKYQKELLEMIKEPLKTWMPSDKEFESFACNAGITQADQSNTEGLPTDANSNNQNDSSSTSEKTNEDDDCSGLETQPSDDLEERQGALLDQQQDSTQPGEEIVQPVVQISSCEEEVLVTLPVIPDEKLGDKFKSILKFYSGDIEELTLEEKIQIVYALQRQNRTTLRKRFLQLTEKLSQKQQIRKEIRNQHSVNILKQRKVIFMTVSGAAIRASWLESIKPSVIIVEEAAEILESQLVAVIPSSVQHLVMIGDHQQLRPQVHYDILCRKCDFHISMFERLIKGGLDYAQLNQQGRMRDDLAQLVRELGIYKEYKTRDEVVQGNCLPNCLSMPMYFFHHNHQVKTHPSSHSKYNIEEAHQIIRVAKYLLKNGVPPGKITILCSYRGQVNEFNNIFKKQPNVDCGLTAIKVTTIDSFQGKENDIILLSLVCNISKSQKESEAKIGYLSCKNRLCVAISRARCVLYLFGNANLLSNNSKKYWKKIIELMREKKCLGKELSFLNLEQSPCIKKKSIGQATNTAQLITGLKILLDPGRPLEDSFARLAEQFGLNKDDIDFLRSTGKPTEKLLDQFSHCTIGELQDKINSIERPDVAVKVKDYILKNCKCFECTTT